MDRIEDMDAAYRTKAQTHEKRTETHGVYSDLISRDAAIDAIESNYRKMGLSHNDGAKLERMLKALPSTDCDTCIYNVCNYNRVPWESNGELINRQAASDAESATTTDCISLKGAIEEIALHDCTNGEVPYFTGKGVQEILKTLPPVTPTEKTGEWIEVDSWNSERHAITDMRCSECNKYASLVLPLNTTCVYPYCPNCGAKMK